jgi:hypothetical protein
MNDTTVITSAKYPQGRERAGSLLLLPARGAMSSGVVGWLFVARESRLRVC